MNDLPLRVRARRPLVHSITNLVTMDWVARGLLAAGAAPIMAHAASEVGLIASDALLLNIGTWDPEIQRSMLIGGQAANRRGVPVVLDPVGAGALVNRTSACREILENVQIAAVRGNAGEIAALAADAEASANAGGQSGVRGVDAINPDTLPVMAAAKRLAKRYGCIVAVTGPVDLVTDGSRTLQVRSGDPLMAQIPGTGCLGGAIVAAALATASGVDAVAEALLWMGAAAEVAIDHGVNGPGSFATALLDGLAAVETLPAGRIAPPLSESLELYPIISGTTPISVVRATLEAGAGIIQWREKKLPFRQQVPLAMTVRDLCHEFGALFLVNDRVDLAMAVDADGCHVGQDDLPVAVARQLLGPDRIVGCSCETAEEARCAEADGADYIGSGPVYATASKADAGDPYGPAVIERVSRATTLPVVGIGGIAPGNAAPIIKAGGVGVAVISAITAAENPLAASRALYFEVRQAKGVDAK